MKRTTQGILFLLLAGCAKVEEGIDDTIIRGNVIIPPASTEEGETDDEDNGTWYTPTELPMLHYRKMTLTGNSSSFGGEAFGLDPDYDHYSITAKDDGVLDVAMSFETSQGMQRDKTIYELYLYDLDNADQDCSSEFSCEASDCKCEAEYIASECGCVEAKECKEECSWEIVETETCELVPAAGGSTDGTLGYYSTSLEVSGGGSYGIQVIALDSSEYKDGTDYTIEMGALTPDDDSFIVGAYQSDDPTDHGNPVGGASVFDLAWDELNEQWTGKFEMLYLKSVVTTEVDCEPVHSCDCDCGCTVPYNEESSQCEVPEACEEECSCEIVADEVCQEDHAVTEGVPDEGQVYILGGSMPSLNSSIPSGTLYASQAVLVQVDPDGGMHGDWGLDTAEPEETEPEPVDTGDTAPPEPTTVPTGEIVVSFDALQPRVVGWEYDEEEPNEVTMDGSLYLAVEELELANFAGECSLDIYTDVIHGNVTLDTDFPDWANEYVDVYAVTAPRDTNATFTFEWDTPAADHDFILYGSDGLYYAYSLYAYPEIIDTAQWGFHLSAGSTWYLLVLPYYGIVGDDPYTIEIEYSAL